MAKHSFTSKWITLLFFSLSCLLPYNGAARASRKIQSSNSSSPKAAAKVAEKATGKSAVKTTDKRASNKGKRNADLDGSGLQNQVSPDGKGGTITTSAQTAYATTTGASVGVATAASTGVATVGSGIPSAVRAAGDGAGITLLGYTPTPTPSPTPSQAASQGMQMAAALAGALASMFGGGGGNQNKNAGNASQSGGPAGAPSNSPSGMVPAGPETRADDPPAARADSTEPIASGETTKPTEPVVPSKNDLPVPATPTPAVKDPPPLITDANKCSGPNSDATRRDENQFYVPMKPSDMIVTLCNEEVQASEGSTIMTAAKADKITPLTAGIYDVDGKIVPESAHLRVATLKSFKPAPIFPVSVGKIVGPPSCTKVRGSSTQEVCKLKIKHPKCPGQTAGECISVLSGVLVDTQKGFQRPVEGQDVSPCQAIGTTDNTTPSLSTQGSPTSFTNFSIYSEAAINGKSEKTQSYVTPFTGFKGWEDTVQNSKSFYDNHEMGLEQQERQKSMCGRQLKDNDAARRARHGAPTADKLPIKGQPVPQQQSVR